MYLKGPCLAPSCAHCAAAHEREKAAHEELKETRKDVARVLQLAAELKSAREENARLRGDAEAAVERAKDEVTRAERAAQEEIAQVKRDAEAALARDQQDKSKQELDKLRCETSSQAP